MQEYTLVLNGASKATIQLVGNEQTPIMIFDDFVQDTHCLIDYSCGPARFETDRTSYYPGVRCPLPRQYVIDVLQSIYQQICDTYNIPLPLQLQVQPSYFSLLTHAPEQLNLLQRFPHFDTSKPFFFAVLHYLNNGTHGNTGLFRHKQTGFERISDNRVDEYLTSVKNHVLQEGEPKVAYITASDEQYELYHQIKYRPNRLVIYPGNLLHSTIVNPSNDLDDNPKTGRLTANIFINFE